MICVDPRVLRLPRAFPARAMAALLALAVAWGPDVARAADADPTAAKIRLMSEALRARDAGDLIAAQNALVQLIALAPNDEAARRLRNEIEAQAVAQQATLAQQAVARQAAEERAAVEAVRRTYTPPPEPVRPTAGTTPAGGSALSSSAPSSAPSSAASRPPTAQPAPPAAAPLPGMIDVRLPEPDQPFGSSTTPASATSPAGPGATSILFPRDVPRPLAPAASANPPPVISGPLARKLTDIVLPEVNFARTSLDEAVAWLSRASAENDAAGTSPRGVNVVLLDPARRNPPVTLSLRGVTVKRVLDFMTESVGFGYEVQDDVVLVRPAAETARAEEVRQVEIEARFVEVPATTLAEAATTWDALRRLAPAGSSAAGSAYFTSFVGEFDVTALVRALTQKNGSELLAAPAGIVISGQPATMAVMQDVRYPQGYKENASGVDARVSQSRFGATSVTIQAAPPQDFASRRVGAELAVTAFVNADDRSITLDLHPKLTAFERFVKHDGATTEVSGGTSIKVTTAFQEPLFSVREIATRVKIPDGATLVLGGLNRERVQEVDRRFPLLGDLPGLGALLRVKGEEKQQRDLLIFITARVVVPKR